MVDRFPHMNDTDFPGLPGETAFLNNSFDYSKYDKTQMRIGICSVPWDVGLIHVGNAQIGGLGNVVYFETPEARDEYLDSIEDKFVWETEYREYHTDMYIQVDLPYETAVKYNYVWVEYTRLPVDYSEGGKERFFFFIRECSQLAPSTCKVKILRDTWQTFIHDINISYFMLEQGHAPMTLISADEYLANPIENNSWLLSDDVNFGDSYRRKYHSSIVLNGSDMWCVFVTTANPLAEFGEAHTDDWDTPNGHSIKDGQPTYYAFAIDPDDLSTFLDNVDNEVPQFAQTVQGVFFIARNLVSTDGTFRFASVNCTTLIQRQSDIDLAELTKDAFGFGEDYRELAKLYTYPYSFLEIADDSGNVSQIKIEETSGNLSLKVTTSLAYPWIAIDGRLSGIGEGSAALEFFNIDSHTFNIDGNWYDHIYNWNIPTFGITQSAAVATDYQTYFDRKQKALELQTALDNAVNSANTSYDNAIAIIETEKTNADASANAGYDNAVNRATTAKTNADARDATTYGNAVRSAATTKTNADASDLASKTNADASADTAKTNADNSAATAKTNADNSALTTQTNADNMALANRSNAYDANATEYTDREQRASANKTNTNNMNTCISDNAADVRGTSTIHATNARTYADKKLDATDIKIDGDLYADHASAAMQAALTADLNLATMVMNQGADAISNVGGGAMNGAIAGAAAGGFGALGGAALGAASAAIGSAASASLAATSYAITVTNSQQQLDAELAYMLSKANIQKTFNRAITDSEHDVNALRVQNDNALNSATTNRSVLASNAAAQLDYDTEKANATRDKSTNDANALRSYNAIVAADLASYNTATTNSANEKSTANTNAANTQTTTKANAARTYTTETDNNARTKTTADENALDTRTTELAANVRDYSTAIGIAARDKATSLANNERTYDTGSDNAQRTLDAAEENAQRNYDTGIAGIQARLDQAALEAPKQYGTFADGETSVTRPQGLFCNIVTQSKDAIEQTGDHWLRFGYRCNRAWKFETFNLMKHFTYWKAADLWISGNNVPDAYLDEIRFYLMGGVCVWKNPDDIGRISVYDNL